jgi:hypothetical protein
VARVLQRRKIPFNYGKVVSCVCVSAADHLSKGNAAAMIENPPERQTLVGPSSVFVRLAQLAPPGGPVRTHRFTHVIPGSHTFSVAALGA